MFLSEEIKKGVIQVTLNRPEIHNAFNDEMISGLTNHFEELNSNDSVRLVILTGSGKSFCAGADLNWMKKMKDYSDEENFQDSKALAKLFETINNCPVPVLGKINGAALGGGAGLISVCDYVMACKSAKIGFTEVLLGLVPAVISPFVMAKIGETHARGLFLSGEIFLAPKAAEIGLVHEVVPLDDLETSFEKALGRFLKAGPKAAREAKALVKNVLTLPKNEVQDYTCKTISRVRISDEGQEGMTALLEKRKSNWIES